MTSIHFSSYTNLCDKISKHHLQENRFLPFCNSIISNRHSLEAKTNSFVNEHFEGFRYLYEHFYPIKRQVTFLREHGVDNAGIDTDNDEFQFHSGNSVESVITKLQEHPSTDYVLTEFNLVNTRDIDASDPLVVSYRRKDWAGGYFLVELVSTYQKGHPWHVFITTHTFLRLTDNEGNVITVGKYPKEVLWDNGNYMKQASQRLSSPDACDCKYPQKNQIAAGVEFTFDEFNSLKEDLKLEMQEQIDGKIQGDFNYFVENCAIWCLDKIKQHKNIPEINIKALETTIFESIAAKYMPKYFSMPLDRLASAAVCLTIIPWAFKVGVVITQGGLQKNEKNPNSVPVVNSYWSLFSPTLTPFYPPDEIVLALKKAIEEQEVARVVPIKV